MKNCCFSFLLFIPLFLNAQKTLPTAPEPKGTPATERLAGLDNRKKSENRSVVKNIPFRNVGPTIMSGRVVDIDVNPADPTIFYVAYASGGVWFTNNNGTTFTPVFDDQNMIDIGDIVVNWENPTGPEIWVGTGECNSSRSSYAGNGIYHSKDGGKNWEYQGLPETHHIGKILLQPSDKKTLFIAAIGHLYTPNKERGVFKSTDGGATWKQTLFIDETTGVIDMFLDPENTSTIYAIAWHRERKAWNLVESGATSGIYKSLDNGETWKLITDAKSGFPQGDGVGRIGLNVYCANSKIVYAIVDNQGIETKENSGTKNNDLKPTDFRLMTREQFLQLDKKRLEKYLTSYSFPEKYSVDYVTQQITDKKIEPVALADFVSDANSDLFDKPIIGAEVYRSEDAGATWKKMNEKTIDGLFYSYGYYFGKIWVSPFDSNELFIAGVELLKSKDGGKTFQSTNGENQHGDHHAMWIDPSRKGHIINGNDGGVNISWDDGATWFKANTPAVGQFYSVNVDMATPYNVYGGLQDNGVWCGPNTYSPNLAWYDDGQYPFKSILGGDGMQVQVDTRDNNTIYAGFQFGHYFRINRATQEATEIHPEMELGDKPLRFNWQAPIWLSVHNMDILYIGAQRLYRSMDQGNHFTAISGDLTRGAKVGDVPYGTLSSICESPMKFGLIYAGSDDGLIHVTKDGGATWTRISDALPQNMRVNRVIASSHVEGRVYAVLSGFQWDHFKPYIYVSENYGATWTQLGLDLPMEPINVVREDPVNENLLFIGTDHGLYTSLDRGKTFMRMFNGLPPVAVHDLMIQTREHDLVIGTHGRSIYVAHIGELEQVSDSVRAQNLYVYQIGKVQQEKNYVNLEGQYKPFAQTDVHLSYYSNQAGPATIRLKSGDGKELFAELHDTCEVGLNFFETTLLVDSVHGENYKAWLTAMNADDPTPYTKGRFALSPGTYSIEIETSAGTKRSVKFTVEKPAATVPTPLPTMDPGEGKLFDR